MLLKVGASLRESVVESGALMRVDVVESGCVAERRSY